MDLTAVASHFSYAFLFIKQLVIILTNLFQDLDAHDLTKIQNNLK